MEQNELYESIARRTGGDIYLGVVGPVRTGKSTFIRRFMDLMVLPEVRDEYERARINDELPQSAAGRTIMTTQPKFVPGEAVSLDIGENAHVNVRLVDCVGYMVDGAAGHLENDSERMVSTPWLEHDIPFTEAAEIGTHKVITEHSTIGLVMTTDGSFTGIPRSGYVESERRVVSELSENSVPFIVVLNTANPGSSETAALRESLSAEYGVTVMAADVMSMTSQDMQALLSGILMEFPISCIRFDIPSWMRALDPEHWLMCSLTDPLREALCDVSRMKDISAFAGVLAGMDNFDTPYLRNIELGTGEAEISLAPCDGMFYRVLGEECGITIDDDAHLFSCMREFAHARHEYARVAGAIESAAATGYGIVAPDMEQMELDKPKIAQQGGRFGVKLRAHASGLHVIRVDVESEISPLVGTEEQSEEFMHYLESAFSDEPDKLWQTNIFGKSLYDLVREGLSSKIGSFPPETQQKLRDTLQRMVNEGHKSLIAVLI